jgi:hypothetical protein
VSLATTVNQLMALITPGHSPSQVIGTELLCDPCLDTAGFQRRALLEFEGAGVRRQRYQ